MNAITIDPTLYKAAEQYATKRNMTVRSFFEYAVRTIIKTIPADIDSKKYQETLEYRKALDFMDTLVADDLTKPVPTNEKGIETLVEQKYL